MYQQATQSYNKYGNRKTEAFGFKFDSAGEARRYGVLLTLEKIGKISGLRRQVPYALKSINGTIVCKYFADFVYREPGSDREVVEDYKGKRTDVFNLKAKLFRDNFGHDIRLSGSAKR
jgi:hypothetical protein